MDRRAAELIRNLNLMPHPEGGYYRELYRSLALVEPVDGRGRHAALTTIYFLLPAGAKSRWHRVRSDEIWHYYEGAPLERIVLDGGVPGHCVPSDYWQAARSTGAYTLVGCTVGPGFEFADFEMLADSELATELRRMQPALAEFL